MPAAPMAIHAAIAASSQSMASQSAGAVTACVVRRRLLACLDATISHCGSGRLPECSMMYSRISCRTTCDGVRSCSAQICSNIAFLRGSSSSVRRAVLDSVLAGIAADGRSSGAHMLIICASKANAGIVAERLAIESDDCRAMYRRLIAVKPRQCTRQMPRRRSPCTGTSGGPLTRGHRADVLGPAVSSGGARPRRRQGRASGGERYFTRMPGCAPGCGSSRKIPGFAFSSAWLAASTMPSLTPNFILRGARFATSTVSRPTRSSGL